MIFLYKEFLIALKNEMIQMQDLNKEINELEQLKKEVHIQCSLYKKVVGLKQILGKISLLMGLAVMVPLLFHISSFVVLLIGTLSGVCIGIEILRTSKKIKSFDADFHLWGSYSKDASFFSENKQSLFNQYLAQKKESYEKLYSNFMCFSHFIDENPVIPHSMTYYYNQLNICLEQELMENEKIDYSNIHFDYHVGESIHYSENSKKLFKKL